MEWRYILCYCNPIGIYIILYTVLNLCCASWGGGKEGGRLCNIISVVWRGRRGLCCGHGDGRKTTYPCYSWRRETRRCGEKDDYGKWKCNAFLVPSRHTHLCYVLVPMLQHNKELLQCSHKGLYIWETWHFCTIVWYSMLCREYITLILNWVMWFSGTLLILWGTNHIPKYDKLQI